MILEKRTPLYFPRELTQKTPNNGKITKQIDLASLIASQQGQQTRQSSANPSPRPFEPPHDLAVAQSPNKNPRIMAEAPNLAVNQNRDSSSGALNGLAPAPPPPNPTSSPIPNIGAPVPPKPAPQPHLPPPTGALRPGLPQENQIPAEPGTLGPIGTQRPSINILSDTQGADFKPYLERVLAIVRANWQRVTPEGVRAGRLRGRSVINFIINRDGSIAKITIAEPSGVTQLDVASSTSLVMSNPLPQLPPEFKGYQVKLAFTFDYNMPNQ